MIQVLKTLYICIGIDISILICNYKDFLFPRGEKIVSNFTLKKCPKNCNNYYLPLEIEFSKNLNTTKNISCAKRKKEKTIYKNGKFNS